ncbi:helix-turn-helix domain-containing protein [Nocardia miyunensis]|uniref:helix-turn-helix domain-containing protein n=1 Tax=Nocardia miyunensis TaxID=282684 RepID=UPI000AAD8560
MIMASWDGKSTIQIAHEVGCHPQTVRERLHRFNTHGLEGLGDRPGSSHHSKSTREWLEESPDQARVHPGRGVLAQPARTMVADLPARSPRRSKEVRDLEQANEILKAASAFASM